jgi:hypothetical protein
MLPQSAAKRQASAKDKTLYLRFERCELASRGLMIAKSHQGNPNDINGDELDFVPVLNSVDSVRIFANPHLGRSQS